MGKPPFDIGDSGRVNCLAPKCFDVLDQVWRVCDDQPNRFDGLAWVFA